MLTFMRQRALRHRFRLVHSLVIIRQPASGLLELDMASQFDRSDDGLKLRVLQHSEPIKGVRNNMSSAASVYHVTYEHRCRRLVRELLSGSRPPAAHRSAKPQLPSLPDNVVDLIFHLLDELERCDPARRLAHWGRAPP